MAATRRPLRTAVNQTFPKPKKPHSIRIAKSAGRAAARGARLHEEHLRHGLADGRGCGNIAVVGAAPNNRFERSRVASSVSQGGGR
jgi:hypothetical protein